MNPLDFETWHFESHPSIASTQTRAKALAKEHAYVCVKAKEQTEGRGRFGRAFYSPPGGVYFSFVFSYEQRALPLYTPYTAWVLKQLIQQKYARDCAIKWVNDLYYRGKKVAGILTETVQTDQGQSLVIGIGVNIATPDVWPKEIAHKAGSLEQREIADDFVPAFLQLFFANIDRLYDGSFIKEYEKALLGLGGYVKTNAGIHGVMLGVTALGALRIETETGVEEVSSGEIALIQWDD